MNATMPKPWLAADALCVGSIEWGDIKDPTSETIHHPAVRVARNQVRCSKDRLSFLGENCKEHIVIQKAFGTAAGAAIGLAVMLSGNALAQQVNRLVDLPTDRMIIKYRTGTPGTASGDRSSIPLVYEAGARRGVQLSAVRTSGTGVHILKVDRLLDRADAARLAADLAAADPNIEYAEPDRRMQVLLSPNDSRYNDQWHYFEALGGANLPSAWNLTSGSNVVVAVIDTGYRPHADLVSNLLPGYDFISDTFTANDGGGRDTDASDPGDWTDFGACGPGSSASASSWHGTHVAGTISAVTNNSAGVAGVAFGAKIVPVRALGKCGGYTSDIADSIVWSAGGSVPGVPANANPARVINMSLGGFGACDITTQSAINTARGLGAVVVVAAGNESSDASSFNPANCNGVVTVAAVNRSGQRAWYSNFGSLVDLAAPGGDTSTVESDGVLSTLNAGATIPAGDSLAYYQGTSMAAPHVAGVAALVLARNSSLTPDQVETILKSTARTFPSDCAGCGTGIVDAHAAALGAGAGGGGGGGTIVENETNNSRQSAQRIDANPAVIAGTISSKTDTDYFAVQVGGGKTLTAKLVPNAKFDGGLEIQSSNGAVLASSKKKGNGVTESASTKNANSFPVTMYVRVIYQAGGVGPANGAYTLNLTR